MPTGFVRRIDLLGRITIPMEIRKSFGFVEEQPLIIAIDGNNIVLKKYSTVGSEKTLIEALKESVMGNPNIEDKKEIIERIRAVSEILLDMEG